MMTNNNDNSNSWVFIILSPKDSFNHLILNCCHPHCSRTSALAKEWIIHQYLWPAFLRTISTCRVCLHTVQFYALCTWLSIHINLNYMTVLWFSNSKILTPWGQQLSGMEQFRWNGHDDKSMKLYRLVYCTTAWNHMRTLLKICFRMTQASTCVQLHTIQKIVYMWRQFEKTMADQLWTNIAFLCSRCECACLSAITTV